ncbi:MAG: hypothetical protein HEQ35_29705 [Gloeotrichia echinulata IR180]
MQFRLDAFPQGADVEKKVGGNALLGAKAQQKEDSFHQLGATPWGRKAPKNLVLFPNWERTIPLISG